jgi:hypothetical protein
MWEYNTIIDGWRNESSNDKVSKGLHKIIRMRQFSHSSLLKMTTGNKIVKIIYKKFLFYSIRGI